VAATPGATSSLAAPPGRVVLSASSDFAVEAATYPVLVVPRGVTLSFA